MSDRANSGYSGLRCFEEIDLTDEESIETSDEETPSAYYVNQSREYGWASDAKKEPLGPVHETPDPAGTQNIQSILHRYHTSGCFAGGSHTRSDQIYSIRSNVPEPTENSSIMSSLVSQECRETHNPGLPWSDIITRLCSERLRKYLVHDLVRCSNYSDDDQFIARYNSHARNRHVYSRASNSYGFAIIVKHTTESEGFDHYHVLHDCTWNARRCSCVKHNFYLRANEFRRPAAREQFTKTYVANLLEYFCTKGREIVQLEIGIHQWRYPGRFKGVSHEGDPLRRPEGLVAEGYVPREGMCDIFGDDLSSSADVGVINDRPGPSTARRGGRPPRRQEISEIIIQMLEERSCSPPELLFTSNTWLLNKKTQFLLEKDREVQVSLEIYKLHINDWSIEQFMLHYMKFKPLFHANSDSEYHERYLPFIESLRALCILLLYQFNNSVKDISVFLNNLVKVCNKENGKINTIFIHGQSNSGKNFFGDCLINFFLNSGMITNPSRQERFPFMDCVNRRILMWNEARLDPFFIDDFKQITGGDQLKANIKFKAPQYIKKTPVIVLSNQDVFSTGDNAFKNRIIQYKWHTCKYLETYIDKYPTPLAMGYMLLWACDSKVCVYDKINEVLKELIVNDSFNI
ncbi:nonstructural protein [Halyomorpha halys erranti-like virus 1]|nr:nonstructural protein [Halyomorpha halys erranti-like virus 1]